jgi:hypothetical protein
MKKLLVVVALIVAGFQLAPQLGALTPTGAINHGSDAIAQAYQQHRSDLQVEGQGIITRILPDDTEGGRHQRFILRLDHGKTVLVAHNIDLAPRVENMNMGDSIAFYGEYEWNEKGGVIRWTHHDPAGRHANGWLKHQNKTYQ